jgi:hypothetical protein
MHSFGENRANCVNRIVPVETFGLQAREGARDWKLVTHRDLGFDDSVERGVRSRIRQLGPSPMVVPENQMDPLVFVQR